MILKHDLKIVLVLDCWRIAAPLTDAVLVDLLYFHQHSDRTGAEVIEDLRPALLTRSFFITLSESRREAEILRFMCPNTHFIRP